MKPSLQLKLTQHLTLTPQLQQSIRLLQLSTVELNQEVERFLQENPLLERSEIEDGPSPGFVRDRGPELVSSEPVAAAEREAPPPDTGAFDGEASLDSWSDYRVSRGGNGQDDDETFAPQQAASISLREHLEAQLSLMPLPARDRGLVRLLIDNLDDGGYLDIGFDEISALCPEELEIEPQELQIALQHLQHFDPPGVGARSPAECLAIQLRALPEDTPRRALALKLVIEHLELLAARDFARLKRVLRCDDQALRETQQLIQSLNPRPGASFTQADTRYVVPDVVVRKIKGRWSAMLNEAAVPRLKLNRIYADILARNREGSGSPLGGQLQEAKWLIRNVQQRCETILRVSQAIVERQRHFLDHGEVAMRPLVLREIADELDLHESTISRVTTQKYMLTPRGTYELKYFFGSHVATDTGGACSATAIRALIKQLVASENPRQPLTDSRIAEILGGQGIVVARRTIAKYRESLQIAPVNLRKSL
ncbi:MAG: RNA polymerase factor sigma-54 [Burkholderiales bacterium]|nr:MAG: RNA polymerase factor sigma-54 [Burkholderiales bacterium]